MKMKKKRQEAPASSVPRIVSSSILLSLSLPLLLLFVHHSNCQLSDNQGYQPRYNPQYTNIQQNPSTTSQYENPLLKSSSSSSDFGGGNNELISGNKNVIPPSSNSYNSYFESNALGSGGAGGGSSNSDLVFGGRNYGVSNGQLNDIYSDEDNFCPEHWISFRQNCYRFVRSPKRNWINAKKICSAYQGNLVNVDHIEKHSFILKQLIMRNQRSSRYWISARQTGPNNWINEDNTQLLMLEDAFSRDEADLLLENEDLHDNRYLVRTPYNNNNHNNYNNYNGEGFSGRNQNQKNNLRGFYGK